MNVRITALAGFVALLASGCSGGGNSNTTTTTSASGANGATAAPLAATASSPTTGNAVIASTGDATSGKQIFSANCAQCHGATGHEGGVGPSLTNEKSRKNQAQAVAWIKNPAPPMPKLFPSPLSDKDVNDVAAYVESL